MTAFPRTGGSYAEYVSVPAFSVARKPSVLSHAEAAAVPLAALTAWGAVVDLAKAHEGQKVLIHAGAGGVGHLAVQIAAYFGAEVVATASLRMPSGCSSSARPGSSTTRRWISRTSSPTSTSSSMESAMPSTAPVHGPCRFCDPADSSSRCRRPAGRR